MEKCYICEVELGENEIEICDKCAAKANHDNRAPFYRCSNCGYKTYNKKKMSDDPLTCLICAEGRHH